jgi:D-proline reductase (dithiol) PrdB
MGDVEEFSWKIRLFLKAYSWRRIEPVPQTPMAKPLREAKVAIVSSAGFTLPDQEPFDRSARGGDFSYREIPNDIDPSSLISSHRSQTFDHSGMAQDPNLAFPIGRLQELQEDKEIGSVNHRHFSQMGSITAPGRLTKQVVPEIVRKLVQDQVDVTLLVPV